MSKAKEMLGDMIHPPEKEVVQVTPKEGPIDLTHGVKMITVKHPYLKPGVEIFVADVHAARNRANGWAK